MSSFLTMWGAARKRGKSAHLHRGRSIPKTPVKFRVQALVKGLLRSRGGAAWGVIRGVTISTQQNSSMNHVHQLWKPMFPLEAAMYSSKRSYKAARNRPSTARRMT